MPEGQTQINNDLPLEEYKNSETHLYGELVKACRRYSGVLDIISLLGILEMVKQEIKDLERTNLKYMKEDGSDDGNPGDFPGLTED